MSKIIVEDVLKKHNCYPEQMKEIVPRDGKGGSQYDRVEAAIKEIVEEVVNEIKERITDEVGTSTMTYVEAIKKEVSYE